MFTHQLHKLLKTINQKANHDYELKRLLTDTDHRNQALNQQFLDGDQEIRQLINLFRNLEDQLPYQYLGDRTVNNIQTD
jgi:hypothetical protein